MLYLLWFAPLFAVLLVYGHGKRKRILASFATRTARLALAPLVSPGRRILKAALVLLVFPLLAVGLAGFQHGYSWQTIERQGVSLMLALDCSKSMLATDVAPSRIERAKRKIHDLAGMLQGDKVGLVAFAGTAFLQCPLTLDYSGFDLFLSALRPEDMPAQGTDLAAAVRTALAGFDLKDGSERAILLVTDGESPGADGVKAALAAAEEAAAQKTRIFCVGVGSPEGAPVPDGKGGFKKDASGALVHSKLDEDTLQKMAAISGGAYVRSVAGDLDLDSIYKQRIRGAMEAKTLSSGRKQLFKDRFRWFLGLALALLLIELLIPAARPKPKPMKSTSLGLLALLSLCALAPASALAASASSLAQDGLAAYEKQDYEAALKLFLDAQIKSPEDPVLAYDAGNAQYRLKHYEEARNNYQTALQALEKQGKAAPAELAALKPKALYNLGNAHFRLDQLPEAAKSYEQTLKLDPNDEDAKKNLELVKKLLKEKQEQKQQQDKKDEDKKDQEKKDSEQKKQDRQQDERQQEKQEQKPGDKQDEQKKDGQEKDDKQPRQAQQDKQDKGEQGQQPDRRQDEQNQGQGAEQQKFESSINASDLEKQAAENQGKPEEKQQAQAASPGQEGENGENPAAASPSMDQNMLNRLKDRPGMAAMPKYQPRRVEKDW
jgi:Ca-activated chloride channel family protein